MKRVLILWALLLAGGCAIASPEQTAQQAWREHERLMAAVYQQHPLSFATAMNRVRPLINRLIRDLQTSDPALAASIRDPFLRLEVVSQTQPPDWDQIVREAVLVREALRQIVYPPEQ